MWSNQSTEASPPPTACHRLLPQDDCGSATLSKHCESLASPFECLFNFGGGCRQAEAWIKRPTCFGLTGLFAHVRLKRLFLAAPEWNVRELGSSPASHEAAQAKTSSKYQTAITAALPQTLPTRTAAREGVGVLYLLRLSRAQGTPVGVLKAGSSFSPNSTAFLRNTWERQTQPH